MEGHEFFKSKLITFNRVIDIDFKKHFNVYQIGIFVIRFSFYNFNIFFNVILNFFVTEDMRFLLDFLGGSCCKATIILMSQ